MRFFDRENEIATLQEIQKASAKAAQFTVVTGRRRIGKTSLVWKAYEKELILYFFVARKAEWELCEDFRIEIENKLNIPSLGKADSFIKIFEYLMKLSQERQITLFIDEFQDFYRINKSVYSDMQRVWDIYSPKAHINLIVCGSIYSMMTKIFKDKKEPLYNRQTHFMTIRRFAPLVLKEILKEYNPKCKPDDLLALYSFTGGVAKYVQLLIDSGATTKEKMINYIASADSLFLGEGKAMLIEEFGKDYAIYFSILSAIATGKTSRTEIENVVGRQIGGYLTNLEREYGLISKKMPLYGKSSTKNLRYIIDDNFLTFWFRFIYKYSYILEIENYSAIKKIIARDYDTFSGVMLERWYKDLLIQTKKFTRIGGWWDRKGENGIDIIAENELNKSVTFYEVKRNASKIDYAKLKSKAERFMQTTKTYKDYTITYKGLSVEEVM